MNLYKDGCVALRFPLGKGHPEVVGSLLGHGADVHEDDNITKPRRNWRWEGGAFRSWAPWNAEAETRLLGKDIMGCSA